MPGSRLGSRLGSTSGPTTASAPPRLLVLGHVTRDETPGGPRLGGAASYAALAAARLGVPTALVTVAPPDDPLLEALRAAPNLRVHVAPDAVMTTFALAYAGPTRRLFLRARARSLRPDDVPDAFRAPIAYMGPVAAECDRTLAESVGASFVGAGLQGWLRGAAPDGRVVPALSPEAVEAPRFGCATVSIEDHPEVERIAAGFAAAGATVAITRAARGATILSGGTRFELPAFPAREVDPTGAGDVFGVVLTLGLAAGAALREAARAAAEAAARVVEGPGLGRL